MTDPRTDAARGATYKVCIEVDRAALQEADRGFLRRGRVDFFDCNDAQFIPGIKFPGNIKVGILFHG
ncbi:hypothetical protein L195_g058979 [Trifolium pratense]|uniref:Uncharacterized protein n=1 Tax=Trifolium pratense TaxID=57577 RepID=A0A2K3JVC4_TRIPR|nr:hypothetical protein L195_g058979 [Trifolium pratense]